MPYTITTLPEFQGNRAEGAGFKQNVTRIAVATLDEAREAVAAHLRTSGNSLAPTHNELRDSGGTIGPLPDGTVIEVRRVSYDDLRIAPGVYIHGADATRAAVLAAFNVVEFLPHDEAVRRHNDSTRAAAARHRESRA